MTVNDQKYWDQRFQEDWQEHGGPEQTRFFTRLALDAMPEWFVARLKSERMTLCDWGCAEGEGTALIAAELNIPVVGIDFSEPAIDRARTKYPRGDFRAVDLLLKDEDWHFDVMYTSNTLEHFEQPWSVFDKISRYAERYVVVLVPYREEQRHPEHFASFEPDAMPMARGDWALVHAAVIDAGNLRDSHWAGKQIFAIYARSSEMAAVGVPLAEVRVDTPELERYRDQIAALIRMVDDAEGASDAFTRIIDRMQRAEMLAQWSVRVWGEDAERRQAMEALTSSVLSLQERLVDAIGEDLRRMQEQQAQTVRDAERQIAALERERQRANEAAARDIERLKHEYERATLAAANDIRKMQDAVAAAMASAEQAQQHSAELQLALENVKAAHADQTHLLAEREASIGKLQSDLATLRAEREETVGRLRSDLASMRGEVALLRPQAATLDLVLRSASWRMTRPLRFMRRLMHQGLGSDDRARLRARLRQATRHVPMPESLRHRLARGAMGQPGGTQPLDALPTAADLSMCAQMLAPQPEGLADVFVWSVIDWHFRTQRPQHLARAMSENGHRVFYLSNNLVDTPEPGYSVEALDAEGRLFQVHLNVTGVASIYSSMPTAAQAAQLRASVAELLGWTGTRKSLSLVQHPFWTLPAQCLPNAHLVYDCMDHHAGFDNNAPPILAAEADLIEQADLVIATSDWLRDELAARTEKVALIRNATDHTHFMTTPEKVFADEQGRRVIGYYGAIAEWFDVHLVRRVAQDHPEALVLLVGNDTVDAAGRLAGLPNVRFTGEVPYRDLPYWLYGFDVCLLPFKVLPLTQATNPVKVYEYLSAARRVVAVDLPEMAQFKGLVGVAADYDAFSDAVTRALASPQDQNERAARRAFAAEQTWAARADALDRSIAAIVEPRVSVVVLTYNNIALTQACLRSLELHSDYPALEIIVVDNASVDGTREFLAQWRDAAPGRKLILNEENRGFAAGNNQGLEIATGDVLVMLNNDTYVTPGWVRTLLWQLRRDDAAGMVGPVTNNIGNEARIEIHYDDMEQMLRESSRYTLAHAGLAMDVKLVAFFCVMLRRSVYERVGGLDEAFGMGFFEDDDYCRRVVESGWKIICAEDVFVHHHLSASFGAMKSEQRKALFDRNRAIYEAKWGAWEPHVYRPGRDG